VKDFIRPLTQQIEAPPERPTSLRQLRCASRSDRWRGLRHCGSPLSMLDLKQAEGLWRNYRKRKSGPTSNRSALPIALERVRRQTERNFVGFRDDDLFGSVASSAGADLNLVTAGLSLVARWFLR
jgi:hypothetical protein